MTWLMLGSAFVTVTPKQVPRKAQDWGTPPQMLIVELRAHLQGHSAIEWDMSEMPQPHEHFGLCLTLKCQIPIPGLEPGKRHSPKQPRAVRALSSAWHCTGDSQQSLFHEGGELLQTSSQQDTRHSHTGLCHQLPLGGARMLGWVPMTLHCFAAHSRLGISQQLGPLAAAAPAPQDLQRAPGTAGGASAAAQLLSPLGHTRLGVQAPGLSLSPPPGLYTGDWRDKLGWPMCALAAN